MGLFSSSSHHKRQTYGQAETNAMQPWLFNVWRSMQRSGGNPYSTMLDDEIQQAYTRAAKGAGQGMVPGAQQAIQADVRNRGGIAGDLLRGRVGMAGQQNMLNTAGQAAGYLGALTSARPQFGFESASPWDQFMGGIDTLAQPAQIAMSIMQGRPDLGEPDPQGLMGPGQGRYDPFAGARTFSNDYSPSVPGMYDRYGNLTF